VAFGGEGFRPQLRWKGIVMTFVTTRHRETTAGTLRLVLETERPPTAKELEDLERLEQLWAALRRATATRDRATGGPDAVVDEDDEAIWELGGEEAITAG
jgi:hypothetical protein